MHGITLNLSKNGHLHTFSFKWSCTVWDYKRYEVSKQWIRYTLLTCLTSISFRALLQSFSEFAQVIYSASCAILRHYSKRLETYMSHREKNRWSSVKIYLPEYKLGVQVLSPATQQVISLNIAVRVNQSSRTKRYNIPTRLRTTRWTVSISFWKALRSPWMIVTYETILYRSPLNYTKSW
jgi:hypothetical protein